MRKLYAERRDATAAGLESVLGKHMRIDSQPGGMHLILRPQGRALGPRLVARMREDGLYAEALTDWTVGDGGPRPCCSTSPTSTPKHRRGAGRRILA
jgi:GntR family transcriptional regulator/MocR family aminotransferase